MKTLSITQILITILISYLVTSYIYNEFNPFILSISERFAQVLTVCISLFVQLGIKNN